MQQREEKFEERKAQKREKSRMSLLQADNERQEEADRQARLAAAEKRQQIEKAVKLPPTALMNAIVQQDESVCLTVLQHVSFNFSEAHTRDGRGCTTLHAAAERGLTDVCRALLMLPNFKDAGVRDNEGWTALHRAAKNGMTKCCKCLCSHPALNGPKAAVGRDNFTALHCAAIHGFAAAAKMVLDHPKFNEADNIDRWGRTALHCAAEYGHAETAKVIMEHTRFTNHGAKTKWGATALDVASDKTRVIIAKGPPKPKATEEDEQRKSMLGQRNSVAGLGLGALTF